MRVCDQHNLTVLGVTGDCDSGTVTFRMHPAARLTTPDGMYTGTAANGEPVQIRVIQGGRMIADAARSMGALIPSVQVGTFTSSCSSGTCTTTASKNDQCARQLQDTIWITPDGGFDLTSPDSTDAGVSGTFAAGELSGTLSYPGNSASCSTSFTARL